jgi:hypothetical protein
MGHRESQKRDPRHRKRVMVRFGLDQWDKTAFTTNLSIHGVLLQTNHTFPPRTILQVQVQPPDGEVFQLSGRVVWVKRVPPRMQSVKPSTMGLFFKEPTPEWVDFCQRWNS